MCVKVLLAEDAESMRRALSLLFTDREDIAVVGEAKSLPETFRKILELKPDVVIVDLHMSKGVTVPLPDGPKVLAISFTNDAEIQKLADDIGADRLLDTLSLSNEMIPAVLRLGNSVRPEH